jgi:pyruvate/2-oxoglutarate dehydrogenase complex dihydrolipoamide dehydrogenase (E3) component
MENILKTQKGVTALTQTRTLAVEKENIAKRVTYTRGGVEHSVRVDEVLVAAGRVPEVDLGLENAGVEYTPKGIEVDEYLQTTNKSIFAAGDVLGRSNSYTHTALLESRIAAHNMFSRNRTAPDYTASPRLTFTYPGVASVGLTENDCIKRDLNIKIGMAPLNIIARSNTSDFRDGFVKIITNKKNVIIGATVVTPHAGEIIHELALAVKYELTAQELADTPHAFLSWSEAVRVAASRIQ